MTLTSLRDRLGALATQLDEHCAALSTEFEKDELGRVVSDGSDLGDALRLIEETATTLSAICTIITFSGVEE